MKLSILITAYAVNPYKGSEDGTGWNIILNLATSNNIIAITRKNNKEAIERFLKENPDYSNNINFEYFDLPQWARFWKKGGRGALLYHYLWHLFVVFFIISNKFKYDIAHHLNFHSSWSPSFLWLLRKPFVWGPIGHHPVIPFSYIKKFGWKATLTDRIKWWTKKFLWTFDPFLKITKYSASKILAVNSSVQDELNVAPNKIQIVPAIATKRPSESLIESTRFRILSVGRFVALKGFDICVSSYAKFYHAQPKSAQDKLVLTLVGKGPEKRNLEKLIRKNNLPSHAIEIIEWMEQAELMKVFAVSKLFFFPSHEGAGMVVPEALSYQLPVICFDNYGPGETIDETCGIRIRYSNYEQSINDFADALKVLFEENDLRTELSWNAGVRFATHYTWEKKTELIQKIYDEVLFEKLNSKKTFKFI